MYNAYIRAAPDIYNNSQFVAHCEKEIYIVMKKLSREQLRNISGGFRSIDDDSEFCTAKCFTDSGTKLSCKKDAFGCLPAASCSNASLCKEE